MRNAISLNTSALVFAADGLIPAIIQEADSHRVLMLGYMNEEAVQRTVEEGRVTFWSRSRQEFWRKGDTSGHSQFVRSVSYDCDADTLLIEVEQIGAACHTGSHSCFDDRQIIARTNVTIATIATDPSSSEGTA